MANQPFIVTLDGPAGVGKTTLARSVAAKLGVAYLDTGAMVPHSRSEIRGGSGQDGSPRARRRSQGTAL